MDALFTSVIRLHEQGLSIKSISRQLGISEQKTRKILITVGAWSNSVSIQVQEMRKAGKSIDDITSILGITRNAVLSYTPYDRGMQNAEYPTINALRIRASRARKKGENDGNV